MIVKALNGFILTISRTIASQRISLISIISIIIIYLCPLALTYPTSNTYKDLDICNHWNGRRHFLELGERGDLHARNVTVSPFRSTFFPSSSSSSSSASASASSSSTTFVNRTAITDIWYQCNLELVTCAECVIRITFMHANFSKSCERVVNSSLGKSSMCPCEHIQFSEPPYDTALSGQEFCGDGKVFRSKTRTLLLKFFYRATNSHVFSLQYFSERNVKMISGSPRQALMSNYKSLNNMKSQIISTPYFPMSYPRDYGVEHILTCEADNCHVRLDFTDFQLGLTSTLEIFDSNGQMLDSYTGEHFRPPIIISSGKSLLLQFRGNGNTGAGFRAEVIFISEKQLHDGRLMPYTDCGGMVSGPGGAITMMNMIENATDVRYFDCIWIIKPGSNYMMMKTHISLRVEEFHGMASRSDLTIRQGSTSDSLEVEKVIWPNNGMTKQSHVVPILTGYYIRLRGVFGVSSKLAIVYSVFNYLNCYIGSEFLCGNNHCISIRLHCDGFDHCGDDSDEPDTCEEDWAHLQNDRRWYSHKPNYYFPKMEHYPDLKTATGIFIISTLGIFAVLSGWMVVLYRMSVRARHQRELQNHLQTISELLDRQEEMAPDEPPSYEAPPDYDEVIKVGMVQEMNPHQSHDHNRNCQRDRDRHHRHHHRRRRRRERSVNGNQNQSSPYPYCRCSERPTTSRAARAAAAAEAASSTIESPSQMDSDVSISEIQEKSENPNEQELCPEKIVQHCVALTHNCETSEANQATEASTKTTTKDASSSTVNQCPCKCTHRDANESNSNSNLLSLKTDHMKKGNMKPNISCTTFTQLEENTCDYCNDSLGISLSLALPQNTTNNTSEMNGPLAKYNRNLMESCTEQTHLKRSWVVISNGTQTYKFQRLRHTFSSPEPIQMHHCTEWEQYNYGTIMPQYNNRMILSNNSSNFVSELSRDTTLLSGATCKPSSLDQSSESLNNEQNVDHSISHRAPDAIESLNNDTDDDENDNNDDDKDMKIFCFGHKTKQNRPQNKRKRPSLIKRHHSRSKSFTNANSINSVRYSRMHALKRSSSLDYVINSKNFESSDTQNNNSEMKIYMI